jgi:hypothetical protein
MRILLTIVLVAVVLGCAPPPPPKRTQAELIKYLLEGRDKVETSALQALKHAASIEIVFLVPDEVYSLPKKDPKQEYFNWWKVVSRRMLNKEERKAVVERLSKEIAGPSRDENADCFEPRHALRVRTEDGHSLDIVLCFSCHKLWCFDESGKSVGTQTGISPDLRPFFDALN